MSSSTLPASLAPVTDDEVMSGPHPRADGPVRRRRFTPAQKLEYLTGYEQACLAGQGGAYLRREGLYSSQVTEWRRLRDAGVLAGREPGESIGALSRDQAEIARLRRRLEVTERRLATTETALEIMGKAHELLERISESSGTDRARRRR